MGAIFSYIPNQELAPDPTGDMTPNSATNPSCGQGNAGCNDPPPATIYGNPMNKQQNAGSTFDTALGGRSNFMGISPLHL
tara:strand:+ start:213 stop:452 length:240 start_codon:yes stop_codon:yes gene_type:complete